MLTNEAQDQPNDGTDAATCAAGGAAVVGSETGADDSYAGGIEIACAAAPASNLDIEESDSAKPMSLTEKRQLAKAINRIPRQFMLLNMYLFILVLLVLYVICILSILSILIYRT